MTAFNNFDVISICCLSFRRNMNLRKSRFNSKPKRNSSSKDNKSSAQKRRSLKSAKCPSESSLKTPAKHQKSVLDDLLVISPSPNINLVTSTPISHEVRKRISRSSNERAKLKSFNRISCPIVSSPIQKAQFETKPFKIKLKPVLPRGGKYSSKTKVDQILKKNQETSNDPSSFSLNSSVEISHKIVQSRSSMSLRSKKSNDAKMTTSKRTRSAERVSTAQKHLSNNQKSVEKLTVPKKDLHSGNKKGIKELSICIEKLPLISSASKYTSSVPDKYNVRSTKNPFEVLQPSQGSLRQSYNETDSSKPSRYSLRKSSVPQEKSYSKKKVKDKKKISTSTKTLVSPSTSDNLISDLNKISRRNSKSHNVELSQHSQTSCLSVSNNEIENSKSSRYSLRLQQTQHSSKKASGSRISSKTSLKSHKVKKTPKSLLESSSDNAKRSRFSLRLEEIQLSKDSIVNNLSQHSSKKTLPKKQKLVKKKYQDKASESSKKISNSSKKQSSSRKSAGKCQRDYLSLSENIPIDDLLSFKCTEKRKAKSDGFKVPGKNTLKRKRSVINAKIKADEDYEDDLYEAQKFDQFKELLMDTSDSERSFSISTPKFPNTPLIRHKTPKYRDCFSPGEYEMSRKAAMEYMYRSKKKKKWSKTSRNSCDS